MPKIVYGIVVRGVPKVTASSFGDSAADPVLLLLIAACLLGHSALIAINFIISEMLRLATSRLLAMPLASRTTPLLLKGAPQLSQSRIYPLQIATFATGSGDKTSENAKVDKIVVEDQALAEEASNTDGQPDATEGKPAAKFQRSPEEKEKFKKELLDGEWNSFVGGLSTGLNDDSALMQSIKLEQEEYKKIIYSPAQL